MRRQMASWVYRQFLLTKAMGRARSMPPAQKNSTTIPVKVRLLGPTNSIPVECHMEVEFGWAGCYKNWEERPNIKPCDQDVLSVVGFCKSKASDCTIPHIDASGLLSRVRKMYLTLSTPNPL